MIVIRAAEEADAATMSNILCASIRDLCRADHRDDPEIIARWTGNKTPDHLARWLANPNLTMLLAERAGVPAGVGCMTRSGEILLNYVAPEHRFCGVTRALLAHAEAHFRDIGLGEARLTSTTTARRFYLDAGFAETGAPVREFGLEGWPMAKPLSPTPVAHQAPSTDD